MPSYRLAALGALLLSVTTPASAQVGDAASARVWVRAETGVWTEPLWGGAGLGVSTDIGPATAEASYAAAEAFWGGTTARTASLAGGLHRRVGWLDIGVLAGPAVSWGRTVHGPYRTLGATAKTSLMVGLGPGVRLGLEGRVLVNPEISSVGVGPALRVKVAGRR